MVVSHCMGQALKIARLPKAEWAAAIEAMPVTCPRADCTGGMGCQQRVGEYLRMQWRMLVRRDAIKRSAA